MRLIPYNTIDEALDESRKVTKNHNGGLTSYWLPDSFKILQILGEQYAFALLQVINQHNYTDLARIDMYPSEMVKAAQDFQLMLKTSKSVTAEDTARIYMAILNGAIARRVERTAFYSSLIHQYSKHCDSSNAQEISQISYFCALIRAYAEMVYCDNHTSGGDIFGPIECDGVSWIVKSFRNFSPGFTPSCEVKFESLQGINIFCGYKNLNSTYDMIGNSTTYSNDVIDRYFIELVFDTNNNYISFDIAEFGEIIVSFENSLKEYSAHLKMISQSELITLSAKCMHRIQEPIFDYFESNIGVDYQMVVNEYSKDSYLTIERIYNKMSIPDAENAIIDPRIKI